MNDFLDSIEGFKAAGQERKNSPIHADAMKEMQTAGIEITPPTYDVPDSPDQKILDQFPDGGFGVQMAFDGWKSFLSKPVVTDRFADNADRSKWRVAAQGRMDAAHGLEGKMVFNEIYKSNKLNGNALNSVFGLIPFIERDQNGEQITEFPKGFPVEELQKLKQLAKNIEDVKTGETRIITTKGESVMEVTEGKNPWDTLPLQDTEVDGHIQKGKLTVVSETEDALLKITNYLAGKK